METTLCPSMNKRSSGRPMTKWSAWSRNRATVSKWGWSLPWTKKRSAKVTWNWGDRRAPPAALVAPAVIRPVGFNLLVINRETCPVHRPAQSLVDPLGPTRLPARKDPRKSPIWTHWSMETPVGIPSGKVEPVDKWPLDVSMKISSWDKLVIGIF